MRTLLVILISLVLAGCATPTNSNVTSTPANGTATPVASTPACPTCNDMVEPSHTSADTVTITEFAFTPREVHIWSGANVSFANAGKLQHTATSDDARFDSGQIKPGEAYVVGSGLKPGTYRYHCANHPSMNATLVVDDLSTITTVPAVTPSSPTPTSPTPSSPPPSSSTPPVSSTPPSSSTPPPAPPPVSATIRDFSFLPSTLNVPVGTTVTWTNAGGAPHTVTEDNGVFGSSTLDSGQTFSHTFATNGTFSYHCAIHGSMHGTVVVG